MGRKEGKKQSSNNWLGSSKQNRETSRLACCPSYHHDMCFAGLDRVSVIVSGFWTPPDPNNAHRLQSHPRPIGEMPVDGR